MLWPYGTGARRGPARIDAWLTPRAWKLEGHSVDAPCEPREALAAVGGLRLRDLPVVGALFALRGIRCAPDATLERFFSTPPFLVLDGEPDRELVFGVVGPFWRWRRGKVPPRVPSTPEEFRQALSEARLAALGNFRAEPAPGGCRLWTETWVQAPRRREAALFTLYWLVVGPFSAWIRRLWLRAAQRRIREDPRPP